MLRNNTLFLEKVTEEHKFRYQYSFICQGTSTRRQRSDLCGL